MLARFRRKLSYSNVIATLALFIALGGVAAAAGIANFSIGPRKLKNGAVTTKKLRKEAVTNHKIAAGAVGGSKIGSGVVTGSKIAAGAVTGSKLANGSVTSSKLGKNSVTNQAIDNGVVGTNKLGNEAVTGGKLAKKSVGLAKLDDDVLEAVGKLTSGQTLRGVVYLSGSDPGGAGDLVASTSVSFPLPMPSDPNVNVIDPSTATDMNCPGGANSKNPKAAAGQLCIYVTSKQNALTPTVPAGSSSRLGFAVETKSGGATGDFNVIGQWAVTVP